jgi:hypothetical protein
MSDYQDTDTSEEGIMATIQMEVCKRGKVYVAIGDPSDGRAWGSRCTTIVRLPTGLTIQDYETEEQARLDYETFRSAAACRKAIDKVGAVVRS